MVKPKKTVIRIGDKVKIVASKIVKRVGYPLIWTDIADEVRKDPRTIAAYRLLTTPVDSTAVPAVSTAVRHKLDLLAGSEADSISDEFVRVVARMRVVEIKFGGNERQIIYKKTRSDKAGLFWSSSDDNECADYTGAIFEVTDKKVVKTGTRYPASGGSGGFWQEYDDYEPGGLADCKTHVLLYTSAGWIEEVNVALVQPGEPVAKSAVRRMLERAKGEPLDTIVRSLKHR